MPTCWITALHKTHFSQYTLVSGRPVRHNHVHINFAESLQCSGNGNISLVGGASSNEGRVEVCVNGMWGTVTNYGWDSREAKWCASNLDTRTQVSETYVHISCARNAQVPTPCNIISSTIKSEICIENILLLQTSWLHKLMTQCLPTTTW